MAGQSELQPDPACIAIDRSNEGLGGGFDAPKHRVQAQHFGQQTVIGFAAAFGGCGIQQPGEIQAADELLPRSGEQRALDGGRHHHPIDRGLQIPQGPGVQHIGRTLQLPI